MILLISSTFDKTQVTVKGLQDSCIKHLIDKKEPYDFFTVPGAVEIPIAIQHFLTKYPGKYSVAIALGCVIKGDTDHYEWVMKSTNEGLTRVALDTGKPVIQGVLVCREDRQALERQHLGEEFARTAITMRDLMKK